MPPHAAFHLFLHCLRKYIFPGIQNDLNGLIHLILKLICKYIRNYLVTYKRRDEHGHALHSFIGIEPKSCFRHLRLRPAQTHTSRNKFESCKILISVCVDCLSPHQQFSVMSGRVFVGKQRIKENAC